MQSLGTRAGCEIWEDELTIAVVPGDVTDYTLAHEMAHLIIELESRHLKIGDGIPRADPNRKVLGLLLSCFEHSTVYPMVRDYGIDTTEIEQKSVAGLLAEVLSIKTRPSPPLFYQNLSIGYADLRRLAPDHEEWPNIRSALESRHRLTLEQGIQIEMAMSESKVKTRAFRAMFDDVATAWQLGEFWRAQVIDVPAGG
jgi:hypothetical protein